MTFAIARQRSDGKLTFFSTGEFLKAKEFANTWVTRSEAVIVARGISRPTIVLDLGSDVVRVNGE